MESLFIAIRQMTFDSRMIAFHTGLPQYKIEQVKNKLFRIAYNQERSTCDWWIRLFHGEHTKDDLRLLERHIEQIDKG